MASVEGAVFANGLIGLREGLEASLIVSIVVAYLVRTGRRDALPRVWAGVAAAVVLSLLAGALLTWTAASLSIQAQELLGGVLSIIAVGFVTWMVFWMKRTARGLKGELEGKTQTALGAGGLALVVLAFLSVAREGLETALFLWASAQAAGSGPRPLVGALLGLLGAVGLARLLYLRAVRIDLGRFFTVSGALLIVVAAGVVAYGAHDLQEARLLPGLGSLAFDVSAQMPPTSWYGTLLKGTVNFSPTTTWLEALVWVAYLVPVAALYLRRPPRRAAISVRA